MHVFLVVGGEKNSMQEIKISTEIKKITNRSLYFFSQVEKIFSLMQIL